jgi:4-hydroxy-tetrahydrodipicolinate synthase
MFRGIYTAVLTPFQDGEVDMDTFKHLINWQVKEGVNGLVIGTLTGEVASLTIDEWKNLLMAAIVESGGQVPIWAGIFENDTIRAVQKAQLAMAAGADAVMLSAPFLNNPSQNGLMDHIALVHNAIDIPLVLYNNPARTGIDMNVEMLGALRSQLDRFSGLVDASSDMSRLPFLRDAVGEEFSLFSGDDLTNLAFQAMGGHGVLSITSNLAPRVMADYWALCAKGDVIQARAYHDALMPLHWGLQLDADPTPLKFAADIMGICREEFRLPLTNSLQSTQAVLSGAIAQIGLDPVMFGIEFEE